MIETAKAILGRGDIVLIFPEGTRTRPGTLGRPHRGVGRLALETGAPVVPVAVLGTEAVRKGVLIRPHKVRIRAGRALRFPTVEHPSPRLASAVTDRIWPCVMLQWEWLGGLAPIRRIAVIGAGSWGTALATVLSRAGFEVELGTRTREQADAVSQARVNERRLPGVRLPDALRVTRASELNLEGHDLVCLAVSPAALPAVLAAHGPQISGRMGLLIATRGPVPPLGTLPAAFASERSAARAVAVLAGPVRAGQLIAHGGSVVLASADKGFTRQLSDLLTSAGLDASRTRDVTGVQLAGCAIEAATIAAEAGRKAGPDVAGAAAGKVFAEIEALARAGGGDAETFAGLAGAGELVAAVIDSGLEHSPSAEIVNAESLPLLAEAARRANVPTPALDRLVGLAQGRIEPDQWQATVSTPSPGKRRPAQAA